MNRIIRRILCFRLVILTTFVKSDPRPPQLQLRKSTQTKFVICDHTIERSFAWAARFRRLARDYERLPETLAGLHFLAFAMVMLKQAVHLMTISS